MNAVNSVHLIILVWTFTAVCRADDDISVNCEDVTGAVGKEVTFTCSVSLRRSECCITLSKCYTDNNNDSTIYRQEHPQDPCERKRNSFTCRYTTAKPGPFRFFVQTTCGWKDTEFTVDVTEPSTGHITGSEESLASIAIAAVAGCFIIIVIIMTIIYKMKPNYSKPCGLQKRMLLECRHDNDNSNCPVNMI